MKKYFITTGTVTYAARGRDILQKNGYSARVERTGADIKKRGCGYGIVIGGDPAAAEKILKSHGVKVLGVSDYESLF